MSSATLTKMAKDYLANAIASGTWAKTGKHRYQRATGEVVEKVGGGWEMDGMRWHSAYLAMMHADAQHRNEESAPERCRFCRGDETAYACDCV